MKTKKMILIMIKFCNHKTTTGCWLKKSSIICWCKTSIIFSLWPASTSKCPSGHMCCKKKRIFKIKLLFWHHCLKKKMIRSKKANWRQNRKILFVNWFLKSLTKCLSAHFYNQIWQMKKRKLPNSNKFSTT